MDVTLHGRFYFYTNNFKGKISVKVAASYQPKALTSLAYKSLPHFLFTNPNYNEKGKSTGLRLALAGFLRTRDNTCSGSRELIVW
jgi:hypothetical protein